MSSAHDFYFVLRPFVACEFSLSQMFQSGTSPIQLTGCSCAGLLHAIMSMLAWSGSGKNRCCRIHARSSAGSAEERGGAGGGAAPPTRSKENACFASSLRSRVRVSSIQRVVEDRISENFAVFSGPSSQHLSKAAPKTPKYGTSDLLDSWNNLCDLSLRTRVPRSLG